MNRILRLFTFLLAIVVGPFLRGDEAAASAEDEAAYLERIELRSVVSMGPERLFGLRDSETDRNFWLELGSSSEGLHATAFDADRNTLTLRYGESERKLSLSRARLHEIERPEPDSEPETQPLTREERRELWREQRAHWQALRQRWEAAAKESEEIRDLESRLRSAGEAMRDLMMDTAIAEEGSAEYDRLQERRRELGREFQEIFEESRQVVETHPGFEPGDAEALRRAQRMLPVEMR